MNNLSRNIFYSLILFFLVLSAKTYAQVGSYVSETKYLNYWYDALSIFYWGVYDNKFKLSEPDDFIARLYYNYKFYV